jgi:hypothetical protein
LKNNKKKGKRDKNTDRRLKKAIKSTKDPLPRNK